MNAKLTATLPLTSLVRSYDIQDWDQLIEYVTQLPYGRTSKREDVSLVLSEQKGTCSSKHALLASVAKENKLTEVSLLVVLFKMSGANTPKVEPVLSQFNLPYIPEAHTVIQVGNTIIDATTPEANFTKIEDAILHTEVITPEQIIDYKVIRHQAYLKEWREQHAVDFSFETLWSIREECIKALSV